MKTKGFLVALMGMMLFFSSCEKVVGEGPIQTEIRNTGPFSGIDVRVPGQINYTQDVTYKVEVNAQRNILDVLETYVSNGRLIVRFKHDVNVRRHDDIIINISAPAQNSLRLSGSGNLHANGPLTPSNLNLELSGSGNISLQQLTASYLDADISGSGNITIGAGAVPDVRLGISGSGNIDMANVTTNKAKTTTSGSGYMKLQVAQDLDVSISGSGSVYYRGTPLIHTRISGSGRVQPW
jgi:hypothetical protein